MLIFKKNNPMKNFVFAVAAFIYFNTSAQTWLQPHKNIQLPNVPSASLLEDLISANGGTAIGTSGLPAPGVIKHMRNFHHMEIDYKYGYFPSDGILNPDTCSCANAWCNNGGCNDILFPSTKSGFESLKDHYCKWKGNKYQFTEMNAALESLFPKMSSQCGNTNISRSYPNKWYSISEFGGLANAQMHFKNYTLSFLKSFCPGDTNKPCLVNVLEVGNEPWGDPYPGKDGYHQLLIGAVSAFREYYGSGNPDDWRMKLSTAAFQAHNPNAGPFGEQWHYIDNMIPDTLKPYFKYTSIHNYAFNMSNFNLGVTETPESDDGGFLTVKNLIEWRNQKMQNAKVNITEFAWNAGTLNNGCGDLGESTQAAYTMRGYMLAARYNVHRAYVYDFTDKNEYPLYCTTGLYKDLANNVPRKTFLCIQKLRNSNLTNKRFLKALAEYNGPTQVSLNSGKYVFIFGDTAGKPTHIIAWRAEKLSFENNNYPATLPIYDTITLPSNAMNVSVNDAYTTLGWDNSQDGTVSGTMGSTVYINAPTSNVIYAKLSGMPIVIPIKSNGCKYDIAGNLINCISTATGNDYFQYDIHISYNAANNNINIGFNGYSGNASIQVLNTVGQMLKSELYIGTTNYYSFPFISTPGIYFVKLELNNKQYFIKKIVVN